MNKKKEKKRKNLFFFCGWNKSFQRLFFVILQLIAPQFPVKFQFVCFVVLVGIRREMWTAQSNRRTTNRVCWIRYHNFSAILASVALIKQVNLVDQFIQINSIRPLTSDTSDRHIWFVRSKKLLINSQRDKLLIEQKLVSRLSSSFLLFLLLACFVNEHAVFALLCFFS